MTFTANGKNETFAVCLQLPVQENQNILFAVNSKRHFCVCVCDLFKDCKKRIENHR